VPATPANTITPRRAIKNYQASSLINLRYVALDHGLPFSTWSLTKLADFLVAEGVVEDISHEGLRQVLREQGVSFPGR